MQAKKGCIMWLNHSRFTMKTQKESYEKPSHKIQLPFRSSEPLFWFLLHSESCNPCNFLLEEESSIAKDKHVISVSTAAVSS